MTHMQKLKRRKLLRRGRARDWDLRRKGREDRLWKRLPRAERRKWFEQEMMRAVGDVFSPKNVARHMPPGVAVGDVRIRGRYS